VESDDAREEQDVEEGLSTPQKVIAGAALGVAVPAAVGVARKLLGSDDDADDDDDASSEPTGRERRSTGQGSSKSSRSTSASSKTKTKAKSKSSTSSGTKARRATNRTREQLYRQATRLKIEGRSSMNKAQLERAIERAKAK